MYPNTLYSQSGNVITRNIFDSSGALVATVNGGTSTSTVYIHPDILGSTNVITNASGQFLEALNYRPFGSTNLDLGTTGNESRGYIGQSQDPESNLDYLNARYYNSQQGQFLSEDSVSLGNASNQKLEDPQSLNTYSYSEDNPIVGKDPTGNTVEIVSRYVYIPYTTIAVGEHAFYYITPNDASSINFAGIQGNDRNAFTLSLYPTHGNFIDSSNKQLGTASHPDEDLNYINSGVTPVNEKILTPPNGETDTQFVNNLGAQFNNTNVKNTTYLLTGSIPFTNSGNSNTFAYTLGANSGVQSQIQLSSFNPGPYFKPGYNTYPSENLFQYLTGEVNTLKNEVTNYINNHT
jgi:RHS repeat-associated protein